MDTLNIPFGWLFVTLGVLFALGIVPRLAPRFYPESPGLTRRLAAPLIFLSLAIACFLGYAIITLVFAVSVGLILMLANRRRGGPRQPIE